METDPTTKAAATAVPRPSPSFLPRETYPPMPTLTITSQSTLDKCRSLPLRPSDVFICSYPKSGTTWTQHIVLSLLLADRRGQMKKHDLQNNGSGEGQDGEEVGYEHVSDLAPFYDIDAHWESDGDDLVEDIRAKHDRHGRRVFNTHLRWDMLPKRRECSEGTNDSGQAGAGGNPSGDPSVEEQRQSLRPACGKFIYVTRHLQDSCASFYHHLSNQKEGTYTKGFGAFATDWMAGKIPFGSPLHHVLSFAEGFMDNDYTQSNGAAGNGGDESGTGQGRPLLLLSYERMKINLREEVVRIIDFLGLRISNDTLDELMPTFTFGHMKDNSSRFQPKSVTWLNNYQFLRKGVAGDGARLFAETLGEADGGSGTTSLDDAFRRWVDREGYRETIGGMRERGLERAVAESFLVVVGQRGC